MSFPFLLPVSSVINVAAGSTATIRPEPNGTYFGLLLYVTTTAGAAASQANIASWITNVRVLLEDVVQWELSGAQLQAINKVRDGLTMPAGELPIWFTEPFRKSEGALDMKAWGMVGIQNFTVEVTIDAGATAPGLTCLRYWTPTPTRMGEIRKFKRNVVQVAATGELSYTLFPRNDRYLALHCASGTDITNFKVKINEIEQINTSPTRMHNLMGQWGLSSQSGYQHLMFDHRNRILETAEPFILNQGSQFPIVTQLPWEVTFTMGAANSFTVIREVVGPRD